MIRERMARHPTARVTREDVDIAQLYRAVLGTPEGRKVFDDLMTRCGVDAPVFHPEPIATAYNAARRDLGLEIARLVLSAFDESKPEVKT